MCDGLFLESGAFMEKNMLFMKEAYEEARKAYTLDEVPVGAVMVYQDKIIARGHNCCITQKSALKHAEMIVIEKACKRLDNWRLDDCVLYVTLEPCAMCYGAIKMARIRTVYYGTHVYEEKDSKKLINCKADTEIMFHGPIMEEECGALLKEYFKEKRNSKD